MKDRAQEEVKEILSKLGYKVFTIEDKEIIADAIRRAEIRGCNQACDLFIEITEGDTNEIVARHSKIVANSIRQLKPGKE